MKNQFYVTTNSDFLNFLTEIQNSKLIALDTEFTRRATYYPILSLIQVADDRDNSYIIDCATIKDISCFAPILTNQNIIKIIHSSKQDLQIFYKIFNFDESSIKGIVDTQIMSNTIGMGCNIGYGGLVENILQKVVNKNQQNSDWERRPLSKSQLDYAFIDVLYLERVYFFLEKEINKLGRQTWLQEEMTNHLSSILAFEPNDLLKPFSLLRKNSEYVALLKNLAIWREAEAQKLDIPRQHLIKNEILEKVVETKDCSFLRLDSKLKEEIFKIISSPLEISSKTKDVSYETRMREKEQYQIVKNTIVKIAKKQQVSEQFLLTSKSIKSLISNPDNFDQIVLGWRKDLFGDQIRELLINP